MKINELIERNNELRPGLDEENKTFYDDFLVYVRATSWLKDEKQVEEMLLSILQDILEAQKNGQTAASYFGKEPQKVADQLLKNLPNDPLSLAKMLFYGFFGYLVVAFIPAISVPGKIIDVGSYLIAGLYVMLMAVVVVQLMGGAVYRYQKKKLPTWLKNGLSILAGLVVLFPIFAIIYWVKTPIRFSLDGWVGIAVIVIVLILLSVYQKINNSNSVINMPIYIYIVFQAIVGIGTRLPVFENLMTTKSGRLALAALLTVGLAIFWAFSFWQVRKLKKKDK